MKGDSMNKENNDIPIIPRKKKWWKAALTFFAGWLLIFYVLSNALHFVFGPGETPEADAPTVIEEPLQVVPTPGPVLKERE